MSAHALRDPGDIARAFLQAVAEKTGFQGRGGGNQWMTRCPAHDDRDPSLSVTVKPDTILIKCHAHCDYRDVLAAIGWAAPDLYPVKDEPYKPIARAVPTSRREMYFEYVDEQGTVLYRVKRVEKPGTPKQHIPEAALGNRWVTGMNGIRPIPYNLPAVINAVSARAPIFITEGEKKAQALIDLGLVATTNPFGAGKWREEWSFYFHGADLILLPDNDEPGAKHVAKIQELLGPVAHRIRVVELPGLPEHGDVVDYLAAGYTVADLWREVDKASQGVTPGGVVVRDRVAPSSETLYPWPEARSEAFYGLPGEFALRNAEISEADPMAVQASLYAAWCSYIGPFPKLAHGASLHPIRPYLVVVGQTSKARKGTSWDDIEPVLERVDEEWFARRVRGGLSSAEAMMKLLNDPKPEDVDRDRRWCFVETEYSRLLKAANREHNLIAEDLMKAWDGKPLGNISLSSEFFASQYHFVILGHITIEVLKKELRELSAASGYANRFMLVGAKRDKLLSRPGRHSDEYLDNVASRLRQAYVHANHAGTIELSAAGWEMWDDLYREIEGRERPSMVENLCARAPQQVLRMAAAAALMHHADAVEPEHLNFGLAWWDYVEATTLHIYGGSLGDPHADRLVQAVREVAQRGAGLSRRDIYKLFSGKVGQADVEASVALLVRHRLADEVEALSGGRPQIILKAPGLTLIET